MEASVEARTDEANAEWARHCGRGSECERATSDAVPGDKGVRVSLLNLVLRVLDGEQRLENPDPSLHALNQLGRVVRHALAEDQFDFPDISDSYRGVAIDDHEVGLLA